MSTRTAALVVVTGANGLVGSRICETLVERGARVRAIVRRAGSAPQLDDVEEVVGDFADPALAAEVVGGAHGVITTVHPMGSEREVQEQVAVHGTPVLARSAASAGVARFVHVSTAAVYDRTPQAGDVDESFTLVGDDAGDYPVTKRDADRALAGVDGITRALVRPPVILGAGESSVWNTLRPQAMRGNQDARRANPDAALAWVHVDDLAALCADIATGAIADAPAGDPERGPVAGACTPVNVAGPRATQRDYYQTVCDAIGVTPEWDDHPAWTGTLLVDRARGWGWTQTVTLDAALAELADGLRSGS